MGVACVLLILLFGNHLEYIQLLSGEHMSSSQRFFPRLSRIGLDEKSISQVSDVGADALDASVSKSIVETVSELVDGPTSAAATSALQMSFGHRGCPVGLVRPNAPCRQWWGTLITQRQMLLRSRRRLNCIRQCRKLIPQRYNTALLPTIK